MKERTKIEPRNRVNCEVYKMKNIIMALCVRLLLITHSVLAYWRVESAKHHELIWLFLLLLLLQLVEAVFTIVKKKGVENQWFCLCFFCYLVSTVPAIYMLELDRLDRYSQINIENVTLLESLTPIKGVSLPITLKPDVWVSLIEQLMLFMMVLGRFLLPRGKLSRDQLSQLLFVYIGLASDNSELFDLFNEPPVRNDKPLTCAILVVWTMSLILFTIVLTASSSPKKNRVMPGKEEAEKRKHSVTSKMFQTEIWSILLTFVLQDGPSLCVRLVALVRHELLNYSIVFFTCKNIFVILLLMYRTYVLYFPDDDTEDVDQSQEYVLNLGSSSAVDKHMQDIVENDKMDMNSDSMMTELNTQNTNDKTNYDVMLTKSNASTTNET